MVCRFGSSLLPVGLTPAEQPRKVEALFGEVWAARTWRKGSPVPSGESVRQEG